MPEKRLFMDVHVLQVLPPSCVNRDDVGTPKNCIYGGVQRARVSSQAWKHAMRLWFFDHGTEIGVRTRKLVDLLSKELVAGGKIDAAEAEKLSKKVMVDLKAVKSENPKNNAIAFMSMDQIRALARLIESDPKKAEKGDKAFLKLLTQAVNSAFSADILLFGRMYADNPSLNVDAAAQVAHAISTHETRVQYDYFTAVEDFNDSGDEEENSGAAHISSKSFSSSTLYRYSSLNLGEKSELIRLDREHAGEIARNFIEAFLLSMPTGSVNAYGNYTQPFYALVTLREDMPVNLVPAFERPIKNNGEGYRDGSVLALKKYEELICQLYGSPLERYELGEGLDLKGLLDAVEERIGGIINGSSAS